MFNTCYKDYCAFKANFSHVPELNSTDEADRNVMNWRQDPLNEKQNGPNFISGSSSKDILAWFGCVWRVYFCVFRCFHGAHRRPLPGDCCTHRPARWQGRGGPLRVQSQHSEVGLYGLPAGSAAVTWSVQLQQLGLPEPGSVSEEGRPSRAGADGWETRHLGLPGGRVVLQRCASLRQPIKTVALTPFLKTP